MPKMPGHVACVPFGGNLVPELRAPDDMTLGGRNSVPELGAPA